MFCLTLFLFLSLPHSFYLSLSFDLFIFLFPSFYPLLSLSSPPARSHPLAASDPIDAASASASRTGCSLLGIVEGERALMGGPSRR